MQKSIAIKLLKIVTIIYALFVALYGIILLSVKSSIPFQTIQEAQQWRIDIILYCTPCIVLCVAILLLHIFYFVLKMQKINVYDKPLCVYLTLLVSILLLIGFVAITIVTKQLALILLTIVPSLCMLSFGVIVVINYKRYLSKLTENRKLENM